MKMSKIKALTDELNNARTAASYWQGRANELYTTREKQAQALSSATFKIESLERCLKGGVERSERQISELGLRLVGAETERDMYKSRFTAVLGGITGIITKVVIEPQVAVVKQQPDNQPF